jgi:hypothetical protein
MTEPSATGPPAWVTKRDGHREPFDADKICRSLFAATEALGQPNAFLARELTDATVHFLSTDSADPPPSTEYITGQIVKIVRELGQPALAQSFAQGAGRRHTQPSESAAPAGRLAHSFTFARDEPAGTVARRCLSTYSEHVIFSRDLVSAQGTGLLLLAGLETPAALAAAVLDVGQAPADRSPWWSQVPALCDAAGQSLVVDGPEWHLPAPDGTLHHIAVLTQRSMIVNLNVSPPPGSTGQRAAGPLFADDAPVREPALDAWVAAMPVAAPLRWDWHLQARDFTLAEHRARLTAVAHHALQGRPVAFVFDRPRRPMALAEGMDRQRPAVLMEVGVDLAAFLRLPDVAGKPDAARRKLPSLARMAVSAGAQKRKYLRRHAEGTQRGFLLDRARLAVVPLGLDAVVRALTGHGLTDGEHGLEVARELTQVLHDALQAAGRAAHLDVGLDSPGSGLAELLAAETDVGLSCADAGASSERQLNAASALHAIAGQGTATVLWPRDAAPTAEELVELLHWGWRKTEVVRLMIRNR